MRQIGQLLSAGYVAVVAACGGDAVEADRANLEERARSFVPEDASEIRVAPGIPWVQVDFDVRRDPLEFAVSNDRMVRAQEEGWTLCQPLTSDWSEFEDTSVNPRLYRQEKLYALYKDGVSITLVGMYQSDSRSSLVRPGAAQGEEPIQRGVVIARNSTDSEALTMANALRLSCD